MVNLSNLETFMSQSQPNTEQVTLGGGCFWCLEAVFDELRGILSVESGYAGGSTPNPSYQQVMTGATGHAEVAQITFDPATITFRDILQVFFTIHDPTTLNRQGADVGTQYRSAIFYHDGGQRMIAEDVIAEMEDAGLWQQPIVTEVTPIERFYVAEDYHQDYYVNNSYQPYCQVVIAPKLAKARTKFQKKLRR